MFLEEPDMYEVEEKWRSPVVTREKLACPYLSEHEVAFLLRPESYSDWRRDLQAIVELRPRCILFDLPKRAENLTRDDLRQWVREAQMRAYEVPVFLCRPTATLPCGVTAACLHCHQAGARILQEQINDWTERGIPSFDQIKALFPSFSDEKKTAIARWATSASTKKPHLPITFKELAKDFGVSDRTVERWRDEARELNPRLMQQLEAYRNHRAQKNGRYEVR